MVLECSVNTPIHIVFSTHLFFDTHCLTVYIAVSDLKLAVGRSPGPCFVRIPQTFFALFFQSSSSIKACWNVLDTQRPCASSIGSASLRQHYALKTIWIYNHVIHLRHYLQLEREDNIQIWILLPNSNSSYTPHNKRPSTGCCPQTKHVRSGLKLVSQRHRIVVKIWRMRAKLDDHKKELQHDAYIIVLCVRIVWEGQLRVYAYDMFRLGHDEEHVRA